MSTVSSVNSFPGDAIRGPPDGIFMLRVLKAEPVGRLLGNAVCANKFLADVSRRMFERFIPCIFARTDPNDRSHVFRRIDGVRNQVHRAGIVCDSLEAFTASL